MTDDTKVWTAKPRPEGSKSIKSARPLSGGTTTPLSPKPAPHLPRPTRSPKAPRSLARKILRAFGWSAAGLLGLLVTSAAWITGPLGERTLTAITVNLANKGMASMGLHMKLAGITGLWDGELRLMGVKLFDKDGEWLDLAEAVIYPQWGSVMRNSLDSARNLQKLKLQWDPAGDGDVLIDIRRLTLFDLTFERPPVLTPTTTPPPKVTAGPLRILPDWLELDIGELEMVRLAYGPKDKRVFANVHAGARLSDTQGELRLGVFLSPTLRHLRGAPLPEALHGDVTMSRREIAAETSSAAANSPSSNTPGITSPDAGMGPMPETYVPNETDALRPTPAPEGTTGAEGTTGTAGTAGTTLPTQTGQAGSASTPQTPAQSATTPHTAQLVLNVVWDGTFADIRWQALDTILLRQAFPGIERLWSRTRLQCNLEQWPPSPEKPLQIRMASRFGLTIKDFTERVRASLCTGQFFWDGQTLVARDIDLQVPLRDPHVLLKGSAGFSRASGPGVRLQLEVTELSKLVKALGLASLEQTLGGGLVGRFAVGRGGRHTLWWTRPLPEPLGFANNPLPGFTAAPMPPQLAKLEAEGQLTDHIPVLKGDDSNGTSTANRNGDSNRDSKADTSITVTIPQTVRLPVTLAVHDPRASRAPTALHTRISLESEKLRLPGGEVDGLSLLIRGTSVDADTAPEGTMRRKAAQNSSNGTANAAKGAVLTTQSTSPASEGQMTSPVPIASAAPAAPAGNDVDSDDFDTSGLPRGMVGALELKARSIFALGEANLRSQWLVGGLHGDADVFMAEFTKLAGKLPGFKLGGDVEMTYALPIRRPWPWLDGKLDVNVENWEALRRLIKSPLQGDGMGVSLNMESRFNEKNEPRQYLRAEVKARQVDTPSFNVREVRGDVMSDHAHALADLFSLAFSLPGQRKASPEGPPPTDYDLLKARLQLGAGSGGPVQWSSGLCTLSVAGEDARIDANLKGNVRGMLEGVFNFRTRLLQILKLEVSQGPENDTKNVRLRGPLIANLHENGGLKPVELALSYGKGLEATARFSAQLQPLHITYNILTKRTDTPAGRGSGKGLGTGTQSRDQQIGNAHVADAPDGADPDDPVDPDGLADRADRAGSTDPADRADRAAGSAHDSHRPSVSPSVDSLDGTNAQAAPVFRMLKAEAIVWGLPGQDAQGPDSASALRAQVDFPLRFAPMPAPLANAPLRAEVQWQGELTPLWKLLPMPGRSLSGAASVRAGVGGTLEAPRVQGTVSLRDARYVDKLEGLRLQDITMNMAFGDKDLSRFDFSAADGRGGNLHMRGALTQQGTALLVNAAGALKSLRPLHRDDLSITLSGDLALRGPLLQMLPAGLSETLGGTAPPKGAAATPKGAAAGAMIVTQSVMPTVTPAGTFAGTPADTSTGTFADTPTVTSASAPTNITTVTPPAQSTTSALLAAPMPPHLLLSGNLRLDRGSFQLLQGFSPSVHSLENVSEGTGPPSIPGFLAMASAATGGTAGSVAGKATVAATGKSATGKSAGGKSAGAAVQKAVGTTATDTGGVTPLPQLQISLDAPGHFFIRGKGLDSEWRAALRVEGSAKAPRVLGSFSPVRGTFEMLNRQFRFEGGGIHFNGAWPPNPSLDISLGYKSTQITALIQVLGSARRPKLDLTSQPPLPRDEVMAQVLFGKKMESLSRFETLQAANAARQLVDMGPSALDVLSSTRDALGLQVLRLGSSTAAGEKSAPRDASVSGQRGEGQDLGTTLEAGKYITDTIYVGVEQGTKPEAGTAVRVEVELTPHMSLSGRTSQESSGVGLNWKMDY